MACYQPVLKLAALSGTRVVNNPFWRIADDKFFDAALAERLGIHVPRTFVLPSHSWGEGVMSESLTNLALPIDWQRIADELGFPMYLKPHCCGGWGDVHRVSSLEELFGAYDRSGCETMLLQEEIAWTQYVRCIVVGREEVLPALWDPRRWHYDRYVCADESMPPLAREQVDELSGLSRKLCRALGYDMNTIEWAIRGGVP